MLKRLWFPTVALFWAVMNALLWRAEFGPRPEGGIPVSPELVWERVLTAPDDSTLDIFQDSRKVGWIRWIPQVEEGPVPDGGELLSTNAPEGRVTRVGGYTVIYEGNLAAPDSPRRYRFSGRLEFDARKQWQAFSLRLILRPQVWELRADAREQAVTFRIGEGEDGAAWEQRFTFAELAQPEALLATLGLPLPAGWSRARWSPELAAGLRPPAGGVAWDTRSDWLQIGSARSRVFRVSARLLDRYEVRLVLSRVGEILRVELPRKITLISDALIEFTPRP